MADDDKPPPNRGAVAQAGSLNGPSSQLSGAEAKAEAGELRVVITNGTASGAGDAHGVGSSIAEGTGTAASRSMNAEGGSFRISGVDARMAVTEAPDTVEFHGVVFDPEVATARFEALEARVQALEITLRGSRPSPPPGLGHNLGPAMSADDEDEIKRLITLLKEQRPATVVRRDELVVAADRASKVVEKIKQYADEFFLAAAKKAGEKFGESLFSPVWWLGVAALITSVVGALHSWLEAFPIH